MKILLTGATGYIGKRLLPILLGEGHGVVCAVRDVNRFPKGGIYDNSKISLLEVDFLKPLPPSDSISDIDAAYYLIHSMSSSTSDFEKLEAQSAQAFVKLIEQTNCKQVIYLGGIANQDKLSKHLADVLPWKSGSELQR